jgi:TldD protein
MQRWYNAENGRRHKVVSEGLQRHAALFQEYTELRVQENRSVTITLLNGDSVVNTSESTAGVSARVYRNGCWGFASLAGLDDASIARAVKGATLNARFLADRTKRKAGRLPINARSGMHDLSTERSRRSHAELLEFIRALDAWIAEKHAGLQSRRLSLRCLDMDKVLLTSDGSSAGSLIPRTLLYVSLSRTTAAGDTVDAMRVYGGRGQFEDVFDVPDALHPEIEDLCGQLARKAEGIYPEAGVHEVVLGSALAGILAHEAIGHTTEGDLVLGGSVAGDRRGDQVASELVSLVDFAHTALGQTCPVPVWVDDEGSAAEDALIIDKGVLRSFMHSKETALKLDAAPTGNARAFAFFDEPLVRMRNTAILPGSSQLSNMIASVDNGYYLMEPGNGQADSTSEFMFGVTLGCEIRNGKLGRALRDTTVSGIAFDMLKGVTMVSKDMKWECSGFCGKKQPIPVGMGGPAIRCRIGIGGR